MKSLRKTIMIVAVTLGSLGTTTGLYSCEKEKDTVEPTENPAPADKFKANWDAADNDGSFTQTYQLTITATSDNQVKISSLFDFTPAVTATATVDGNTITIAKQNITNDDYEMVEGSGTLDPATNKITINYTFSNNGSTYPISGVWTKK